MAGSRSYRLIEYKITESFSDFLWWESHFGLGSLKRGQCFIRGNILFIEFSDIVEDGFLKMEFGEQLDRLPKWEKTKYYCSNYSIYDCKIGNKPSLQEMTHLARKSYMKQSNMIQPEIREDISYRLGRYEIIEKNNGQICWESHRRLNILKTGKCFTEGDILFMEPAESEKTGLVKNEFIQRLNRLPNWTKSSYYCSGYSLNYCEDGKICRDIEKADTREISADEKLRNTHGCSEEIKIIDKSENIGIGIRTLLKNWFIKRNIK